MTDTPRRRNLRLSRVTTERVSLCQHSRAVASSMAASRQDPITHRPFILRPYHLLASLWGVTCGTRASPPRGLELQLGEMHEGHSQERVAKHFVRLNLVWGPRRAANKTLRRDGTFAFIATMMTMDRTIRIVRPRVVNVPAFLPAPPPRTRESSRSIWDHPRVVRLQLAPSPQPQGDAGVPHRPRVTRQDQWHTTSS